MDYLPLSSGSIQVAVLFHTDSEKLIFLFIWKYNFLLLLLWKVTANK